MLIAAALATSSDPRAAEIATGGDWALRWDNTIQYSSAFRLAGRDPKLIADRNSDDGDRNFAPGVISNRVDLLSELDLSWPSFGVRGSAAGWYDSVYQQKNANDSPATFNPTSAPHDEFPHAVQALHGRHAELLDAFAYGGGAVSGAPFGLRVGRHALLWGESLYFAGNGIAAGQAPIDVSKALSVPDTPAKELFLPVAQVSASLQPTPTLALEAYDQFEWRKTRSPGAGSYFSIADFVDAGGERLFAGAGGFYRRADDRRAPAAGQYGLSLRWLPGLFDYAVYALRYNAKDPELALSPGSARATSPGGPVLGTYELVHPRGIELYGASFSGYLGDDNIAGEISARRNTPFVSVAQPGAAAPFAGVGQGAAYARGDSLNAQISLISRLPPGPAWDGATFSAEIAGNRRLSTAQGATALDRSRDTFAAALRAVFAPEYFQVAPGLDLSPSIGLGAGLIGDSSLDAGQNARAGDVTIGLSATYRTVWSGAVGVTVYFGAPGRQRLADRDHLSLSLKRSF